jgi:FkbM family methyltransferase
MEQTRGTIVRTRVQGQMVSFFVVNRGDEIQKEHSEGRFYEQEELAIIAEFFPRGGVFIDIGANVGNHTIYVAKFLHPQQVIVIEPNPAAIQILTTNIDLNRLSRIVDLSFLGLGLSDRGSSATFFAPKNNLGGTRLKNGEGPLCLRAGDNLFRGRTIDFIKLDVEGMEVRVLKGLKGIIADQRPGIFVEIENDNIPEFRQFLEQNHYVIVAQHRRYAVNENFMILPIEREACCRGGT